MDAPRFVAYLSYGRNFCRANFLRAHTQHNPRADWDLSMRLRARVGQFGHMLSIWIQRYMLGPIVEMQPIDVINKGFGRRVLGQDERVILHLDVIVREVLGWGRSTHNRGDAASLPQACFSASAKPPQTTEPYMS